MKNMLHLGVLAAILAVAAEAFALPLRVPASFYFQRSDDHVIVYSSYNEAHAAAAANAAQARDPGTGLVHWRITGVKPDPYAYTINGVTFPTTTWEVLQYNGTTRQYEWVSASRENAVSPKTQCPVGYRDSWIVKNPATPRIVEVMCQSATSNQAEEPACGATCPATPIPEAHGNPIYPSTGLKLQREVDYKSESPGGLEFIRTYRSDRNGWEHNYYMAGMDSRPQLNVVESGPSFAEPGRPEICYRMKAQSGHMSCFKPYPSGFANDFTVKRSNGRTIRFGDATGRAPAQDINDRWTPVLDINGKVYAHDVFNSENGSTERYGLSGMIERITSKSGRKTTFAYDAFPANSSDLPKLVLKSVTDHFGKSLLFTYDAKARMETMTTPTGDTYRYAYDESSSFAGAIGNLTSVTYPDGSKRVYWYNEPERNGGGWLPGALTGITDENGARYATFTYLADGRASSTEHAGGVDRYEIVRDYYTQVIDPLGAVSRYDFEVVQGVKRVVRQEQLAVSGSLAMARTIKYDANRNIDTFTNFDGVVTKYTYDLARNLEKTRTEAFGKPEQRTTTTDWHANLRVPSRVAEPKRRTTYTYHPNGELKTRTIQATTDLSGGNAFAATLTGTSQTWTYGYNAQWQLASVSGPVSTDVTTYAYDAVTGDLQTVTNAAGHVTRFEEYDGNGRAGLITQPNGVKTRMRYSPRGWLESMTVSDGGVDLVTTYSYDNVGQLKTVTMPSRSVITYTYEDAHRLTDVADAKGNKIHYVLDNMGNRISEEVTDPSGNLRRQLTREYDALNRLRVQTGGAQ